MLEHFKWLPDGCHSPEWAFRLEGVTARDPAGDSSYYLAVVIQSTTFIGKGDELSFTGVKLPAEEFFDSDVG